MRKGFTLIELLAVIVILAIIAAIATPIVLSIIEDTRNSAILRSVEFYLDGVEQSIARKSMMIGKNYKPNTCVVQSYGNLLCDDKVTVEVEVKGKKPNDGTITFDNGKIKDISLNIENKVVTKNQKGELVIESDPVKAYKAIFADNTWDEIADACQKNAVPSTWDVGNTKTMTINDVEYNVTIIGKNHDTYADGSGVAPLTFQTDIVSNHVINSTSTTAGNWFGSEMYSYLNTELIDFLEFKNSIKSIVKYTNKGYIDSGNTNATEVVASEDKLFLFSKIEIFGTQSNEVQNLEGMQYSYYANGGSSIKNYDGSDVCWWLRTPSFSYSNVFYYVGENGRSTGDYVTNSYGVSFGFCF